MFSLIASVSVGLRSKERPRYRTFDVLPARKMLKSQKKERRGRGRGRKEMLAQRQTPGF